MATIKPIEGRSVHQIQSGQVIVDLNSVVKELVENSLDAGATSIEVRFKNNGLDAIEVQDNGSGISPDDYDTIALKHYTSKLATYDDLTSLQTFGFRGEALSSLCALSKLHIVTARASDGPKGTKLDFEQSGKLKGTSVVAAKQGTTVVVETLFHNLPVRRKELEKTVKREYNKVLQLLNAYACISVGVKFSVSNQVPKGKKTVAFATNSNPNTKENIANVFGTKTLVGLTPLDLRFEMDPSNRPGATQSARNWSTQEDAGSREVRIVGHMSRPVVGEGRQTSDRQMFFVNARPCSLPQVAKAFNEVYKSYNYTQSAFIFADIKLDTNAYDVNVSPDKREILLHDQTALLESLQDKLVELFEGQNQSVPSAPLLNKKLPSFKPPTLQQRESTQSSRTVQSVFPRTNESRINEEKDVEEEEVEEDIGDTSSITLPDRPHQTGFTKASLIERFAVKEASPLFVPEQEEESPVAGETHDPKQFTARVGPLLNELPRAVQDFNARIASQHARQMERERSSTSPGPEGSGDEEEPIPAITQTPQKRVSQSTIQNAFDRMRPMRTPVTKATITIGDQTIVETIGTQSESRAAKRARIHTPKFSLSGKPLSQTPKKPLFMKSLRGFAAPGTQMEVSDDEGEPNAEEEEREVAEEGEGPSDLDSDMIDGPAVPAVKRQTSVTALEEPPVTSTTVAVLVPPEDSDAEEQQQPFIEAADSDDEYLDEADKKAREDAKVEKMIAAAEEATAKPSEQNLKRAKNLLQRARKTYPTLNFERSIDTSADSILQYARDLKTTLDAQDGENDGTQTVPSATQLDAQDPEERLSLTVSKSDFDNMRIIGQFNLGFILATRPPTASNPLTEVFIIDQHASDEKYNFERFSNTTVLESQRMVHPHPLELTAVEEEVILANEQALLANGFKVEIDESGATQVGRRVKLTSLPTSKGVTFSPSDLEDLIQKLFESPPSSSDTGSQYMPRPDKVRKLLAMRACRSSVMVGKTLKHSKMEQLVRNMGTMEKPWNCPHGRPTMRHLQSLDGWTGWQEGDGVVGLDDDAYRKDVVDGDIPGSWRRTDWKGYLGAHRLRTRASS
ncbi:hypothetical protein BDV96DRAFT_584776 [Lophiotrema nucula]|uniref:DNA mismatch repair protein PMS1 n=1 Tax=Lophiotrema nucula TaxID=690887 RepID=A0A6A5YRW4_9PLEO|nr:hypothetical protein BDV96DRAFT_584776 [Lophiotrema nucula]